MKSIVKYYRRWRLNRDYKLRINPETGKYDYDRPPFPDWTRPIWMVRGLVGFALLGLFWDENSVGSQLFRRLRFLFPLILVLSGAGVTLLALHLLGKI